MVLTAQAFEGLPRNCEIQLEGQPNPVALAAATPVAACTFWHGPVFLARPFFAAHGGFARHDVRTWSGKLAYGLRTESAFVLATCPFMSSAAPGAGPVRTLACRGHVSFDKEACKARLVSILCGRPPSRGALIGPERVCVVQLPWAPARSWLGVAAPRGLGLRSAGLCGRGVSSLICARTLRRRTHGAPPLTLFGELRSRHRAAGSRPGSRGRWKYAGYSRGRAPAT